MTVNDVIQVKIEMHDGYGHQKTIGGDLVIGKDANYRFLKILIFFK